MNFERNSRDDPWQTTLAAAATSALWIGCLIVGILGVLLPYAREHLEAKPPPPVAEAVRLMPPREQAPEDQPPQAGPRPDAAPPPEALPPPPDAPPPVAVAAPSPAIAFAVPVEGPTRIVDARYAVPVTAPPKVSSPPVQHLTFGVGQGQQPDPEYPRDALLAREQGTVVVRFTVGPDGRVQSVQAIQPSRWPLLNQAAIRAVRDRWHFGPGALRVYEVPIQFEINEK
jgi:protein TonB